MYYKRFPDNNINSNTFMLAGPGGRQLDTEGLSLINMLETVNTNSLERVRRVVERQPDCGTIVKCDLLWLVHRATGLEFPSGDCNRELSCSLLPWRDRYYEEYFCLFNLILIDWRVIYSCLSMPSIKLSNMFYQKEILFKNVLLFQE